MPKDQKIWFTHDLNARNDRKIASLVKDYKSSGYGIFWCAVEMMHEEDGQLDLDEITFDAIAKDLNEDSDFVAEVIKKCIDKYKLFKLSDNALISNRVTQNISEFRDSKDKKSRAGKASAEKRKHATDVQQRSTPVEQQPTDVQQNPTHTYIPNVSSNTKEAVSNLETILTVRELEDSNIRKEEIEKSNYVNPQTLTKKMMLIYKEAHPKYRGNIGADELFCGEISLLIAENNGWASETVTNGKMDAVLTEWASAMGFAKINKYWFSKTPLQLADRSTWNNLYNALNFEYGTTDQRIVGKDDPTGDKF